MTRARRFGVDEAGKGPVFGPMVVAAVAGDADTLPTGIKDSKRLTPATRRSLAHDLRNHDDVTIASRHITPAEIDDDSKNLNELTVEAFADVIDRVADSGMGGMVDASDTDAERFGRRVDDLSETTVILASEHGADDSDPLVGAASIIAKVERDAHIESLADEYGEIGSGYPSDQTTRTFLADYIDEHGDVPPFARRSWSTCQTALEAAGIVE